MSEPFGPATGDWTPLEPRDAVSLLKDVTAPWWVAGGWALDLFLGLRTRAHSDLDVGLRRCDLAEVRAALAGWTVCEAHSGELYRLDDGEPPRTEVNSLWCRPAHSRDWSLELMLDEADGDDWVFRRQPAVRMLWSGAIRRTRDGVPYLAPEIQLLYKARNPRERDEIDFERTVDKLERGHRLWLRAALAEIHPRHAWLTRLRP